VPASGFLRQQF
jgi:hypothetical protein